MKRLTPVFFFFAGAVFISAGITIPGQIAWSSKAKELLKGKQILYIERPQYAHDHHNTETLFQFGEINTESFEGGSAMRIYNVDNRTTQTLVEVPGGIVRDPELSYDATKVVFSMRKNKEDYYHIYEIGIDGRGLRQLTYAEGVSDIDPFYLLTEGLASVLPVNQNIVCVIATSWLIYTVWMQTVEI